MIDLTKIKKEKSIQELLEFSILNIDKPSGPTSFNISDFVRKTLKPLGVRKTSHFGTLDPKVTGVLPVALNRACKLTGYFIGQDKEYVGIMRMHDDISLSKVEAMIKKKFLGKIKQTPPVKSSVKRVERVREVKRFDLLEQDGKDILFYVVCQGGTYIRKLADDLGKELGIGAHMLELRRTKACIFDEMGEEGVAYPSVRLYDLEKAVEEFESGNEKLLREILIPAEIVTQMHEVVFVKKGTVDRLFTGKIFRREDLAKDVKMAPDKTICVFEEKTNRFIGMYKTADDEFMFAKPQFVLQPLMG